MTTGKTLLCPCEDVTEAEVRHAVEEGYDDVEGVKRFTGLATGPCQGKACVVLCRQVLAETLDVPPGELDDITYRPPLQPVRLGDLEGRPGSPEDGPGGTGDEGEGPDA